MRWVPTLRFGKLIAATPEALRVAVPREVVPSENCTVPVGIPPPGATGTTTTVNATGAPNVEGLREEEMVVVVDARLTDWLSELLVLPLYVVFPP